MSIVDEFPSYEEYVKNAGETLAKVAEYADAARELEEAGKSLTALQKVAKDLTWISKLATGFQIASAALGVLGELFGAKSPQEEIMDALDEISGQISDLQSQVANLGRQVDLDISDSDLFNYWNNVLTTNSHIASYKYKIRHNEDTSEVAKLIREQSTDIYFQAANAVLEVLQGEGSTPAYLDNIYDKYYGDPGAVLYFVSYFKRILDEIVQGHAAILVLKAQLALADGQTLPAEKAMQIAKDSVGDSEDLGALAHIHENTVNVLTDYIHRVGDVSNLNVAVTRFLEDNIHNVLDDAQSWESTCKEFVTLLSDHYSRIRFCVIGYSGKNMLHRYGALTAGNQGTKVILNYLGQNGAGTGPSNFTIFGYPRVNDSDLPIQTGIDGKIANSTNSPEESKRKTFEHFAKAVNSAWNSEKRRDRVAADVLPFWGKAKADAKAAGRPEAAEEVADDIVTKAPPPDLTEYKNDFVWVGRPRGWNSGNPAEFYFGVASQIPIAVHEFGKKARNGAQITDKLACVLCYPTLE